MYNIEISCELINATQNIWADLFAALRIDNICNGRAIHIEEFHHPHHFIIMKILTQHKSRFSKLKENTQNQKYTMIIYFSVG